MPSEARGAALAAMPTLPRRLVYLGTPELSVAPLRALHDAGYDIALVVSRADKRRGRRGDPVPSPVKAEAEELGIPVTSDVREAIDVGAEAGVVVAFGRLVPRAVLERLPMLNIHFSLLPRWRGAAPLERAILAGDAETGVCLMGLEEGLDTGPVFAEARVPLGPDATLTELRDKLAEIGTSLLLDALAGGLAPPRPQQGRPAYAEKIEPAELRIDWTRSAEEIHRLVRLGSAWTTFRDRRLKVLASSLPPAGPALTPGEIATEGAVQVGTGVGPLEVHEVQPEGRRRQPAEAWRNGARLEAGDRLGW